MASSSHEIPTAGYSVSAHVKILNKPGMMLAIIKRVSDLEASLAEIDLLYSDFNYNERLITINCRSESHSREVVESLKTISGVELLFYKDDTFEMHKGGKLRVEATSHLKTTDELSRAYTPGVARVCTAIHENPESVYKLSLIHI